MHNKFRISFWFITTIYLICQCLGVTQGEILKPAIMLCLIFWHIQFQKTNKNSFTKQITAAQVFSLLGDVALMFVPIYPTAFIAGLGLFLIAQITYSKAFLIKGKINILKNDAITFITITVLLIYAVTFFSKIKNNLGDLTIPVFVYMLAISTMGISAALRKGKVNTNSYYFILFGACLFIASDSFLAFNKFVSPFNHAHFYIMLTYSAAQYLICEGSVMNKKE